jgi:hypothetical protein
MDYMLLLFNEEKRWENMPPDQLQREYGAYFAYTEALKEAGVYIGGDPLEPTSSATTVTVSADGKTSVLDGPYADTKEQLAGYYLIKTRDLDEALSWAARCPCASHGTVEVRPVMAVPAPV